MTTSLPPVLDDYALHQLLAEDGTLLLQAAGSAAALHKGWKMAQTLMEWCSGIASRAAAIVVAARRGNPDTQVAGTRKNVPGNRALAVKAFRAGGAVMHRNGLSETLLLFAEHRLFLGQERPAETVARLLVTTAPHLAPPRDVQVRFSVSCPPRQ